MTRRTATEADYKRERQQGGIILPVELMHDRWKVPYGKVVSKHFDTIRECKALQKAWQQERAELERMRLVLPRQQREADALALVDAVRKGKAVDLGPDLMGELNDQVVLLTRQLTAVEKVLVATTAEVTAELYGNGDYLTKLATAYHDVASWAPKEGTPWGEVKAHQSELEEFAEHAFPIVAALESLHASGVTTRERKQLRDAFREGPATMPSLSAIRAETYSRHAATPLSQDIERRAEQKEAQRAVNIQDAAASAAARNIGTKGADDDSAGSAYAKGKANTNEVEEVPA